MSGKKIIEGLSDVLAGRVTRETRYFIGWDMASPEGDFSAITCSRCNTHHAFRGSIPKRCRCCRTPLFLAVVK